MEIRVGIKYTTRNGSVSQVIETCSSNTYCYRAKVLKFNDCNPNAHADYKKISGTFNKYTVTHLGNRVSTKSPCGWDLLFPCSDKMEVLLYG